MNPLSIKDYNQKDTIAAIATYPASSALGVVRISGKKAISIASKVFTPAKKKGLKDAKTFTIHLGYIGDSNGKKNSSDSAVDEVLLSIMKKPHSYTTEDIIEISTHGGALVVNKILELILASGARLAMPGEFTYRAFVNGRIDLLQAESVCDIVEAKSEEGLKLAVRQLQGERTKRVDEIREKIKNVYGQTEALINFPEDDITATHTSIKKDLRKIKSELDDLLIGSEEGRLLKEGIRCVICGKTNAGKSTLFNCLLKEERVIVSRIHGTTRDVIEETISIKGVPLRIYDTAGLLEPKDLITKKAVQRSKDAFKEADLVILVLDGSRSLNKDDYFLLDKSKDKNTICVINKTDLKQKLDKQKLKKYAKTVVPMSALKSKGISALEEAVFNSVYKKGFKRKDIIFLNKYQKQLLEKIRDNVACALDYLETGHTIDFVSFSLKEAIDDLGKLSGEVVPQEVLTDIFSNFCIGK